MCVSKENGGFSFHSFSQFNLSLLAKQGWRLLNYSNSLLARTLKVKYYPENDFLRVRLGNIPSFSWKTIWAAKGVLQDGLCWRVGTGNDIFALDLPCVSGSLVIQMLEGSSTFHSSDFHMMATRCGLRGF